MATTTLFLDYLQKRRKEYVMKKDVMIRGVEKKNPTDILLYTKIIREYDKIIRKYKECTPTMATLDFTKIKSCSDCPECVIYDAELQKAFCSIMKGKSITNHEVIMDWCPYKKKDR